MKKVICIKWTIICPNTGQKCPREWEKDEWLKEEACKDCKFNPPQGMEVLERLGTGGRSFKNLGMGSHDRCGNLR